ncbi:hypothetical protein PP836_003650 [Salmonella enterica]|nr:hypothetical protein [Salmonella enterica subsp. diarizonae]EGV3635863.1 hypothetical protein [Salmonella enterica]EKL0443599.1 hypothetical protein [Salmonella enterica]HCM1889071.1 hypothetical protein [Salmonella enterica subsp. diarizonae serovar 57:c:z]
MKKMVLLLVLCTTSVACLAAGSDWNDFIKRVERADPQTIQSLPESVNKIGDSLNGDRATELATAASFALLKDPVSVLNATAEIGKSQDELIQRFDSMMICSLPMMNGYTRAAIEKYYAQAVTVLQNAGKPAIECLNNMRDTMDELRADGPDGKGDDEKLNTLPDVG